MIQLVGARLVVGLIWGVSGTGFLGCSGWGVWVVFWLVVVDLWNSWLFGVVLWLALGVVLGFVIVLL